MKKTQGKKNHKKHTKIQDIIKDQDLTKKIKTKPNQT